MVNHGLEPVQNWWKPRTFAALPAPQWMKAAWEQPTILLALQQKIAASQSNCKAPQLQSNRADWVDDQCDRRSRDRRLEPLQQSAPDRQLHRTLPRRVQ